MSHFKLQEAASGVMVDRFGQGQKRAPRLLWDDGFAAAHGTNPPAAHFSKCRVLPPPPVTMSAVPAGPAAAKCTLIGDQTDDAVQLLLGLLALSSLYGKWHFESPRRPTQVWFLDAMKQGTSAAMIHVLNIIFAIGIVDFSDRTSDEDECAFYFMNVVIDTTLGVYIAYLLVQLVTRLAVRRDGI
jgi:hypothetical protein